VDYETGKFSRVEPGVETVRRGTGAQASRLRCVGLSIRATETVALQSDPVATAPGTDRTLAGP
jgi:hypothetical protein